MSDQLDAIEALAVDYPPKTVYLSGIGQAVFYYTWNYLNNRRNWINPLNPLDEITQVQWDTLEGYIAQLNYEVDRDIMIGQLTAYITENPPVNVLACDGSVVLRVNYPKLYEVIDPVFIIDADSFYIPDLRDRTIFGAGSAYTVANTGGSPEITLDTTQIPSHDHTASAPTVVDTGHSHVESTAVPTAITIGAGVPAPSALPSIGSTAPALTGISVLAPSISATGGGLPHDNMPPFMALNWGVIAS